MHLQTWSKYLKKCKRIKQNWVKPENYGSQCQIFISGRKTGHKDLSPTSCAIFRKFLNKIIKSFGNS